MKGTHAFGAAPGDVDTTLPLLAGHAQAQAVGVLANQGQWSTLPDVGSLQSGDVLIKHVWNKADGGPRTRNLTELVVRAYNALHIFDTSGSRSAEHAAMVGNVNGEARLFEADDDGIRVRTTAQMDALRRDNVYTVFRFEGNEPQGAGLRLLCDGMATRLAVTQGEHPAGVEMARYGSVPEQTAIRRAACCAHTTPLVGRQSTRYGYGDVLTMLLPNLIPDIVSKHDRVILSFIEGKVANLAYVCSGLVAAILQAWNVEFYHHKVFTDPSQVHPTGLEHHFLSKHLIGIHRAGRWGGAMSQL